MTERSSFVAFIVADLVMKRTEDGGRRHPIHSGYRCNCWVGHEEDSARAYNDAAIQLLGVNELKPGQTGKARIEPAFPDAWSHLEVGSTFELCEGARVVAVGTVAELFPSEHRTGE